jgi:hypothetical protein
MRLLEDWCLPTAPTVVPLAMDIAERSGLRETDTGRSFGLTWNSGFSSATSPARGRCRPWTKRRRMIDKRAGVRSLPIPASSALPRRFLGLQSPMCADNCS